MMDWLHKSIALMQEVVRILSESESIQAPESKVGDAMPTRVDILSFPTPSLEVLAREEAKEKRESLNFVIQIITLIAVVIYTALTGFALRETIITTQISNRAYLSMQKITDVNGGWGAFNVSINNYGHIPSASYQARLTIYRFLHDAKHEIILRRQSVVNRIGGPVPPDPSNYGISFFLTTQSMSKIEISAIANGSESVMVTIALTYDTGFGDVDKSLFTGCLDRHFDPHWNSTCGGAGTSLDFDDATDDSGWKKLLYQR